MTPESQQIALAELCGWRAEKWTSGGWMLYSPQNDRCDMGSGTRESAFGLHAPAYLTDLNAAQAAFKALTEAQQDKAVAYLLHLLVLDSEHNAIADQISACLVATPAQWCEAILRAAGRFEECDS